MIWIKCRWKNKAVTLLFDTSALSALLDRSEEIILAVTAQPYDRLVVPLAVDAELRFGFANGTRQSHNLTVYERSKREFGFEILAPSQDTAILYAELTAWMRKKGIALSQNDIWIASTCIQVGGRLLTLDQDFARLPQIGLVSLAS